MIPVKRANLQVYLYLILAIVGLLGASEITDLFGFSRYCSIIMRFWSIYHLYMIFRTGSLEGPIKYFTLFVILHIIYSAWPAYLGKTYEIGESTMTAANYLNINWMFACPVYSFYWFTKKGYIGKSFIEFFTLCGIIFCVILFVKISAGFADDYGALGNANNSSYKFLQLFPLVFYFKERRNLQYLILAIVLIAIIISSKRGAIVIAVVCMLIILKDSFKTSTKKDRARLLLLSFLFLILLISFVYYQFVENDYFNERIVSLIEGDSSGRDDYYSTLWNFYDNIFSDTEKLFGKGIFASVSIIGNYAHNDWLEYLTSFGIIGCVIYVVYWISLLKFYIKTRSSKLPQSKALLLTIIILFMSSLFSMSYTGMSVFINFSLGYSIAFLNASVNVKRIFKQ